MPIAQVYIGWANVCMRICTNIYKYLGAHAHTHTHTRTNTRKHIFSNICTEFIVGEKANRAISTHTHTHTYAHTHTYTHTNTYIYIYIYIYYRNF